MVGMDAIYNRFDRVKANLRDRELMMVRMRRLFPILVWMHPKNYTMEHLRYDIIAGLTVGITMVPQCLAYSSLANLKAEIGLYSSYAGQFIYVLMGSSKDASVGPDAVICMIVGQISAGANPLYDDGDPTCATILALVTGIVLLAMAFLKLGFVVNLFSIPVVSGFMSAAGITIAASQLKSIFGMKKNPATIPGVFVKQLINVGNYGPHINWSDVAFGVPSIIFLLIIQNLPRICDLIAHKVVKLDTEEKKKKYEAFSNILKYVCACKNVILFVVATSIAYGLYRANEDSGGLGVSLVGYIKPGMPDMHVPPFEITKIANNTNGTETLVIVKDRQNTLNDLVAGFIVLPLMCSMELFAILKALGSKNGYRVDARQELLSIGLANLVIAFLGGMPVTGAVTRCALNDQCRVKTQVGSIISAIIVIICLNTLTSVFFFIPKATLGAVVIVAALNLVDFHIIPDVWRHCRSDAVLLVVTMLICVFFEISYGVLFCLFINMIMFLKAVTNMQLQVTRRQPATTKQFTFGDTQHVNSVAVVKMSHGMKYPSVEKFLGKVEAILAKESHLIIDCTFVQSVDYTGIQAFRSVLLLAVKKGLHVVFANLNPGVQKQLQSLGLEQFRFVTSIDAAIGEYNKAVVISEMEGQLDANGDAIPGGNESSTNDLLQAKIASEKAMEEKARQKLIRRLSIQPHYLVPDFPLTVAGNVNYDGGDDDDNDPAPIVDEEQVDDLTNNSLRDDKPKDANIQFLNRVLLRELSRNSAVRRSSRLASISGPSGGRFGLQRMENVANSNNSTASNQAEILEAITKVSQSPAVEFIDISRATSPADNNEHPRGNKHHQNQH